MNEWSDIEKATLIRKIVIRFSFLPIFLGLLSLLPAGTFDYWQVYVYLIVIAIPMLFVLFYFLKHDPQFLVRRTRAREKEKQQIIIQIGFSLSLISGFIIPGLDRRYGWSDVPFHFVIATDIIILSGYAIIFFVFKQNSYASRIVEIDKDQQVISTGLYRILRHPMYLGVMVMFIPTPVALGSWYGLIPMATVPLALVFRILNEEKVLREGLPGYKEYCRKTKYRLVPFIW